MGIERTSLELPAGTGRDDAEKKAGAQLRVQDVHTWSDLPLPTILTTDSPGISRYTFTYWVDDDNRRPNSANW
ncbi:hypothetical protein ACWEK5_40525 [Rhodococcus koreensis]